MSLRARLALALLLLSALPLGGFALFSYSSSSRALRAAAEQEASELTQELAQRVGSTAQEVDERIREFARQAPASWRWPGPDRTAAGDGAAPVPEPAREGKVSDLDLALPFIEEIAFVPRPPAPPAPGPGGPAGDAPAPPAIDEGALAASALGSQEEELARAAAEAERAARELQRAHGVRFSSEQIRRELEQVHVEIAAAVERARKERQRAAREGSEPEPAELDAATRAQLESAARTVEDVVQIVHRSLADAGLQPTPEPAPRAAPPEAAAVAPETSDAAPVATPAPPRPAPAAPGSAPAAAPLAPASPFGVSAEVAAGGQVVGRIQAKLRAEELLRSVLSRTDRSRGEIPFALDAEGRLYTSRPEDEAALDDLPAIRALRQGAAVDEEEATPNWVFVVRHDPASGFRYGIARPISSAMAELKATAATNFSLGMMLVGLAVVAMIPLSGRFVRDVRRLEEGAARLAEGDLEARVEVRSSDELGRLASAFNHMAGQISDHQRKLVEQERLRKEEEISRRLLAAENERRRHELEEAREFQISLLPRELPRRAGLEVAVSMTTATEVGGDYYDFLEASDGVLVFAVGDATGHGAAAGTMVTAVKGLFVGGASAAAPAEFLRRANRAVHSMGLVRRAMALVVGRYDGRRVVLSAAGMPPALRFRAASATVEEIALPGTPLGARGEFPYEEAELELERGDLLLLLSDGLPELPNPAGEPFGYERLAERFAGLAGGEAPAVVAGLEQAARDWSGGSPPPDDLTFLVLRVL